VKKALVIDDVREIADSICNLLSLLEVDATPAYGALAALNYIKEHQVDCVFVDIHMPGISGVDVITFLRREPSFFQVPIFVITSDDQPETRKSALMAGALEVIVKPVTYDILKNSIMLVK
jgi:two-component system chemotaxis response regulator CheY